MGDFSNLNTNHVKVRTCTAVASLSFDAWYEDYAERADLLTTALAKYNDGRMKRYLCELFIQQDLTTLQDIMRQAEILTGTPKENGKAFRVIAESVVQQVED